MNIFKTQKSFLITLIGIVIVGLPLTVYSLLHQQIFQQFAWTTQQSAVSQCSTDTGNAVIQATFTNTEPDSAHDMNVTITDLQTGKSVNMGTVAHQETKTASLDTGKTSLSSGSVAFHLSWTDGTSGTDQFFASYKAVDTCPPPTNFCPETPQGTCSWDPEAGATGYNVVVKETDNDNTVQTVSVSSSTTQISFPMSLTAPYECTVTPTNECGGGTPVTSPEKTCTQPTPSPTVSPSPSPSVSPSPSPSTSPSPTETPSPTPSPVPTATPIPTATPKPLPSPTPVVIVKILTPPPQQIVITSPPQQTIIRVPGQTNTIVQQGPPQTIVVTQPPQPTARPYSPVTPVPTVVATGNTTPSFIIAGTSAILLIAGGIIFFLL